jgi:MFS family permease
MTQELVVVGREDRLVRAGVQAPWASRAGPEGLPLGVIERIVERASASPIGPAEPGVVRMRTKRFSRKRRGSRMTMTRTTPASRRTYVVGLGVFVVASLACGLAPSAGVLAAARAIQGTGAAAMFATTIALISTSYAGRARGVAFGIWGATNGAAAAAGPIVGGLLTQSLSWRWVFFVNVPIGLVTIVVARRALSETRPADRPRIDWAGGGAFTLASAAATFALVRAHEQGWTSASTLGVLALAAAALAAFAAIELRSPAPMLDHTLLRRGPLAGILVAAVLYSAAAFSALVYASIWLQTVLGLGPISAGLVTLPLSALAFARRRGRRPAASGGAQGVSPTLRPRPAATSTPRSTTPSAPRSGPRSSSPASPGSSAPPSCSCSCAHAAAPRLRQTRRPARRSPRAVPRRSQCARARSIEDQPRERACVSWRGTGCPSRLLRAAAPGGRRRLRGGAAREAGRRA